MIRVSIRADAVHADVALPAAVPVAELLPALADLLAARGQQVPVGVPALSVPGHPPLSAVKSLEEQNILDGTVLVLQDGAEDPGPGTAPATGAADEPGRRWDADSSRLAAGLSAVLFAGVAGVCAVPGRPGVPTVLLGAAGAGTAAAVAARLTDSGRALLVPVAVLCGLLAVAAAPGTVAAVEPYRAGVLIATASVALLSGAARLAILTSGLSRRIPADLGLTGPAPGDDPAGQLRRARHTVAVMALAGSAGSALGVVAAVVTAHGARPAVTAFGAAVAAVLALRAADCDEASPRLALTGGAAACTATLFLATAQHLPGPLPWVAPAAVAVAALWWLARGPRTIVPAGSRWVTVSGWLAHAAVVPAAGWALGLYAAARGMSLR